jgi:uncharacterized protein (DUF2249 family)
MREPDGITGDVTLARLLETHPGLLPTLVEFHPHFRRIENRLLRRVMAPRVTLEQAAAMAGVPVDVLVAALRRAAGVEEDVGPAAAVVAAAAPAPRPAALDAVAADEVIRLDVRDDIRFGVEPFARIMAAVRSLPDGHALILRTPFEPVPLYEVLGKRGFAHWTERHDSADWSVWFYRAAPVVARPAAAVADVPHATAVLDVRGLEPPLPMLRVLERAEALPPGGALEVRHDRRPLFLYPQLEERGFTYETDEPEPGVVRIRIHRGATADV